MTLPKDLPTLQSTSSKNYTRPDNVYMSASLADTLVSCDIAPEARPPCTDHIPILTTIASAPVLAPTVSRPNFAKADWAKFRSRLQTLLKQLPDARVIPDQLSLDQRVTDLRTAIQQAINNTIPILTLDIRSKRWWSNELRAQKKVVRTLARLTFRRQWDKNDPVHAEFKAQRNLY
ncbi:hypothetical protein BDV93DRAFT_422628, partial [Ceratobasidium sp. AG-I]